MDHILFVSSSVESLLGCFHFLAALNTGVCSLYFLVFPYMSPYMWLCLFAVNGYFFFSEVHFENIINAFISSPLNPIKLNYNKYSFWYK